MMYRAVVVAVFVVACNHADDSTIRCTKSMTSPCAPVDAPRTVVPVCTLCTSDGECGDGQICKQYGDGYGKCSPTCEPDASAQCTGTSTGSCNGMGYCMCPRIDEPPMDGGQPVDAAGTWLDAPEL